MARRRSAALPLLVLLWLPGCASLPQLVIESDGRVAMGTALELQVVVRDSALARRVLDESFDRVAELEGLLSHYDPHSTVSRLALTAGEGPQRVDPRVTDITRLSVQYGALTGGAFDVTLGPLIELWKLRERDVTSYEEIASVRARTGLENLSVDSQGRVELAKPGMALDFGGIAKGYALDRIRPLLEQAGIEGALASFGQSSVWALGAPPHREGWELALRSPAGGFAGSVTLRDLALSVSSSFPDPGQEFRFGHIVDPRTGWPLTTASLVAVVSTDATLAEVLSTALLLLHHEKGLALIESQPQTEALIVDDQGRLARSSGWNALSRFHEHGSGFRGLSPAAH